MNESIDYYFILGVYPGVKQDIISLSYQKIQSFPGTAPDTKPNLDINQINQAYLVLSDEQSRAEYDSQHINLFQQSSFYFDGKTDTPPEYYLNKESKWSEIINKHPQVADMENNLAKISWRLAYSYRLYLLKTEYFDGAKIIASQFEVSFLKNFFSSSRHVIDFAKMLIINRKIAAAIELNKLIIKNSNNPEANTDNPDQLAIDTIKLVMSQYSLNSCNFDSLLINAAMRLEPDLVNIYLKAGANPNVLVDGNQSIFACFTWKYRFMRKKGFEEEIKRKYAVDRAFYKYKAKKIDIIEDEKKRRLKEQQRIKYIKKLLLISLVIIFWLIHVNKS